ncbi:MAG TPA: hypothetical protein DCF63_15905 [Planctomycetaceae bacterium]|nr:hypothetical protein [Planctomycetaceae bacterium]
MAVRDRNLFVWQAYVIASSIVSLMLLVGMFFLWRSYSDTSVQLTAEKQKLSNAQSEFTTVNGQLDRVLSMLGYGEWTQEDLQGMAEKFKEDAKLKDVEREFAKLLSLFPANTPLKDKNLIKLPQNLIDTIRKRNEEVAEARTRTTALQEQMTKEINDHRAARETAEKAQQQAEADLAATKTAAEAKIQEINRETDQLRKKYDEYKANYDKKLAALAGENKRLEEESRGQSEAIAKQTKAIQEFMNPDYAAPQGKVTDVRDGGTLVWINLGKADGLTRGVPFSILDAKEPHTTKAVPKARMIIEEVADNYARGRVFIAEANAEARTRYYRNMVKSGDLVYSPSWRSGRKVGFALYGKMGINDSYSDDVEQIRQLIRSAGGTIDDEFPVRGDTQANLPGITHNTSYLIIGSDVSQIVDQPGGQEKAQEYAKFIEKARQNGVMTMSIDKLMGLLKVDESSRGVPLGERTRGQDFKVRSPSRPPQSTGSVSEIYSKSNTQKP